MTTMKNLTQLNVYFKITDPLYSDIIKISKEIKEKYNSSFWLDGDTFLPHLSLYLFALPKNNLPKVLKTAHDLAQEMRPVKIKTEELIATKENLIMLTFEKKNILYQYHLKALNAFNPLREEIQRKKYTDEKYFANLLRKDKKYLNRYGHRYILDQFHPHISIAMLENTSDCQKAIDKYSKTFKDKETKLEALQIMEDDYISSEAKKLIFDCKL